MTDAEPRLMTPHLRRYDTEIAAATHRHRRHRVDKMLVGSWLPTGFGDTTRTDTHPDHHGGWMQATSPLTRPGQRRTGPDRYDPHH